MLMNTYINSKRTTKASIMKQAIITIVLLFLTLLTVEGSASNLRDLEKDEKEEAEKEAKKEDEKEAKEKSNESKNKDPKFDGKVEKGASCRGQPGGNFLPCPLGQECSMDSDFTCINEEQAKVLAKARQKDTQTKSKFCFLIEQALDMYYNEIARILRGLEKKDPDSLEHELQVDFLCKNKDPEDPGVRELASYNRFDFIQKCNQADQAACIEALSESTKQGTVVYRKVGDVSDNIDHGMIGLVSYARDPVEEKDKLTKQGYYITDCQFDFYSANGDPTPYWDKPLPFDPEQLMNVCGDAGYGYYTD